MWAAGRRGAPGPGLAAAGVDRAVEERIMLALLLATVAPPGPARAAPLPPPANAMRHANPQHAAGPVAATFFVNFDGAVLNDEREDARTNGTRIGWTGAFEGYGTGTKRAAVMQAVHQDWQPFAATVTDRRPSAGDYSMVMVGPTNFTNGSLGLALLDCGNDWTSNNVVFAFHHVDDSFTASATATTISQELAHSYGLEHVDEKNDVMYPYNTGGDPSFLDACNTVLEAEGIGILCTEQHQASCGSANLQNGYAELMRFMGPRPADIAPPQVWFTAPQDGATYDDGESFILSVDAEDDVGVVAVELLAAGELVATDDDRPFSWEVSGAPPGTYHFEARAYDAAGNAQTTEVLELVVLGDDEGDTDDHGEGDTDDEPSFGSTGDAGEDEDDLPPDAALGPERRRNEDPYDPFPGSCDCRSGAPTPSPLWLLVVFGVCRRRP